MLAMSLKTSSLVPLKKKINMPRGHLTIVSGPSGCGKSTLIKRFLSENPQYSFPTSATTREPREGELDGDHYYFFSRPEFVARRERGDFLEWAEVYGMLYGTLKETIIKGHEEGTLFLKDIDVQGAKKLMGLISPQDLSSIFIAPPSHEVLKKRLFSRGSENDKNLVRRLEEATREMNEQHLFTHTIVNDTLDEAYQEFSRLLKS